MDSESVDEGGEELYRLVPIVPYGDGNGSALDDSLPVDSWEGGSWEDGSLENRRAAGDGAEKNSAAKNSAEKSFSQTGRADDRIADNADNGSVGNSPAQKGDSARKGASARKGGSVLEDARGGARRLDCVLPAVSAALGSPVPTALHPDPLRLKSALDLPEVRSVVVVLIDGMGFWNLSLRRGHVPYLRSLLHDSNRPIATTFPTTTVAAMGAFGTGTCPGLTGMTGYTQLNTQTGAISQLITFKDAMPPEFLQTQPTVFAGLAGQGVRVTSVGLPKFERSALTVAAFGQSTYVGFKHQVDRVGAAIEACRQPGLTYLYFSECDQAGHNHGWNSEKWTAAFEKLDGNLGELHRQAPRGTLIVITADHGMVQADPASRIDIAEHPELMQDVRLLGGEPRAPMLYLEHGADPLEVAHRWQESLGDAAQVMTRDEAVSQGVYGPVRPDVLPMIGDVVVAANGRGTIVDSRTESEQAMNLMGVHGSRTVMETDIPFLVDYVE